MKKLFSMLFLVLLLLVGSASAQIPWVYPLYPFMDVVTFDEWLQIAELSSAPSNESGYGMLYVLTSSGDIYYKDDAGNVRNLSTDTPSFTSFSLTGELDMTGVSAFIDLNPAGTGTKKIIEITPSASLVAGSDWDGVYINVGALDPATGAAATIHGFHFTANNFASTDYDADIAGFLARGGAVDSFSGFQSTLKELTQDKLQIAFLADGASPALSATATYRGLYIDYDSLSRNGGAPILEGVVVLLPADYSGFGTSYAGKFAGDGRTVIICDTTNAMTITGEIVQTISTDVDEYHDPIKTTWTTTGAMPAGGSNGIYSISKPQHEVKNAYALRGRMDMRHNVGGVSVNQLHSVDALINVNANSRVYDVEDNISVFGGAVHAQESGDGPDITHGSGDGTLNIYYGVWADTVTKDYEVETNGMLLIAHASTYLNYGVQVQNSGEMIAGIYLHNHPSNSPATMTSGILMDSASAAMTYGVNMTGASIGTADILLQNGEVIKNITDGTIEYSGFIGSDFYDEGSESGAFTIDWRNGNYQKVTITGAALNITFVEPDTAGKCLLMIIQGDGDDTLDWEHEISPKWPGGVEPTLSTGNTDIDIITFFFDGGTTYYGLFNGNFE